MANLDEPAAKRQKIDLTDEVVVHVGKGKQRQKFTVAKGFLTKSSGFLQKCCGGGWKESRMNTVKLPDVDPDTFQPYLRWLYTGELGVADECGSRDIKTTTLEVCAEVAEPAFACLTELAILADMLMDVAFGNAVADELLKTCDVTRCCPSTRHITRIYTSIAGSSNIKRLCVDWYAGTSLEHLRKYQNDLHAELVFDIMMRLREDSAKLTRGEKKATFPTWKRRCEYHEHSNKVPKCNETR